MPAGTADIRLQGKTGSDLRMANTALLTQTGSHPWCPAITMRLTGAECRFADQNAWLKKAKGM
jgi:hypothetical protein